MSIQLKGNDNSSFSDDVEIGSGKITLNAADGTATFAGDTTFGGDPNGGANIGAKVFAGGAGFMACRPTSTEFLFSGFAEGNATPTSRINVDGSASFAGNTTYGPSPVINGRQNYLTIGPGPFGVGSGTDYCLAYYASDNTLKYGLKTDGSAEFVSDLVVTNDSFDVNSENGNGSSVTPWGDFVAQRKSSQGTQPVYEAYMGTSRRIYFLANGAASFFGTVTAPNTFLALDTGGVLDVKERLQNTQAILYRLKAALIQPDADANQLRTRLLEALDILTSDGDES